MKKNVKIHFASDEEKEPKEKKEQGEEHQEPEKIDEASDGLALEFCQEEQEDKLGLSREHLERLLKEKEEELQKEHDRLLRALAEYENYKKRMAREKADFLKFGNESLINEILPVLDNLELSLEHARTANNSEAIIEGIELVKKEFLRKLEKFGLGVISALGEKFDPTRHEAAAQLETSEHPENTVVKEFQKGYFIHNRLLRPAKVGVARSPKPLEN